MRLFTLAAWLGCSTPEPDLGPTTLLTTTTPTVDSGATQPTPTLHGQPPEAPVPLPAFSATNRDGTARGPADLEGSPTALWFYPAAFTGG